MNRGFAICGMAITALACAPTPSSGQGAPVEGPAGDLQQIGVAMESLRSRNARDYAIVGANPVDEGRYVALGGIEQWITIRGEDRSNPVLLFLHGGPGDATNPWSYAVFRPWLKQFTVVQWDQRGAGRTLGRNGTGVASSITVERLTQDGVELAEWLRTNMATDKIILVGHSWGSILGVLMAKARPDLFHAYVGTGQAADPSRKYAVAHADLLSKAKAMDHDQAVAELIEIGPPPYPNGRGQAVQRKWSNLFEGADAFIMSMLGLALTAPGYTYKDVIDWFEGQGVGTAQLVSETGRMNADQLAGDFQVPVFVFQGREDFTNPTRLAAAYLESINAPTKAFVAVPGGHFAVFMESEEFLKELVTRVRPLAMRP
jgi:pimeloyl-ACP methyl ester carboxylesterase